MLTLSEILDKNELVLVDTSVHKGNLYKKICHKINYSSLNTDELRRCYNSSLEFLEMLNHPHSLTTPEVTKELKRYYKILKNKRGIFQKNILLKNNRVENARIYENEGILGNILDCTLSICNLSRRIQFEPNDDNYENIIKMLMILEKYFKLTNSKDNKRRKRYFTDEKMIASAYWTSMYSDIAPALLTGDTDFIRLLGVSSSIFRNINRDFEKRLGSNPPKLFMVYGEFLDSPRIKKITLCEARQGKRTEICDNERIELYRNLNQVSCKLSSN